MATFLELVRDLARQSGTLAGGTSLASVSSTDKRTEQFVNWVRQAWIDVQAQRKWNFRYARFDAPLIPATGTYTAASLGLTRVAEWATDGPLNTVFTAYDPAIGRGDEHVLGQISYDDWVANYDRGEQRLGKPRDYAISPQRELCVGHLPDKAYVLRGAYWKAPQILVANDDVPEMAEHLHPIIVARAQILLGESDESPVTVQVGDREYTRWFGRMVREELPSLNLHSGMPLA